MNIEFTEEVLSQICQELKMQLNWAYDNLLKCNGQDDFDRWQDLVGFLFREYRGINEQIKIAPKELMEIEKATKKAA